MGWRRGWISLFLFTLAMINYVDRVALSVASKSIAEEFDLSPVTMGYLFSSFLWTYLLCLIPMGILVDRFGSKIVNAAGITIWSTATMLTGASWNFISLIGTRLAMGIGEATTFPAGGRVVREWIPAGERGLTNAIFMAGTQAGPAVGALLVAWIISQIGWRGSFLVVGAAGFIWLLAWLVWFDLPEKARWLGAAERDKILRERDARTSALLSRTKASRVLDLLRTRTMWGLALAEGCAVYTQYLFLTWLPSYLQTTRGLTIVKTGMFTAVPYAGAAILGIILGRVSDRLLTARRRGQGPQALDGRRHDDVFGGHPVHAFRRRHLVAADLVHDIADRDGHRDFAQLLAGERPAAHAGGFRQGDEHPHRRRQRLRGRGADRHRLRHPGDRQLQLGLRHRGTVAGGGCHPAADHDALADRSRFRCAVKTIRRGIPAMCPAHRVF